MTRIEIEYNSVVTPIPAQFEPAGWEDITFTLARDDRYHGFFVDSSIDLEFFCGGGYEIIKQAYQTDGTDAQININIYYKCPDVAEQLIWQGRISLAGVQFNEGLPSVKCNIEDRSAIAKFNARTDVSIDLLSLKTIDSPTVDVLPVLPFAPYDLNLQSRALPKRDRWIGYDGTFCCYTKCDAIDEGAPPNCGGSSTDIYYSYVFNFPIQEELSEAPVTNGTNCSVPIRKKATAGFPEISGDYGNIPAILRAVEAGVYDFCINGCIGFALGGYNPIAAGVAEEVIIDYFVVKNGVNVYPLIPTTAYTNITNSGETNVNECCDGIATTFVYPAGVTFTQVLNDAFSLTLEVGDSVALAFQVKIKWAPAMVVRTDAPICIQTFWCADTVIQAQLLSQFPETTHKAVLAFEAFDRIVDNITTQQLGFRSAYFGRTNTPFPYPEAGCGAHTALLTGQMLRNITPAGEVVYECDGSTIIPAPPVQFYMSFNELFNGLSPIYNLGAGIEYESGQPVIKVEQRAYFYDSSTVILVIANLDKREANFIRKHDAQLDFNRVKIGYSTWEIEGTAGALAICSEREFATNSTTINNTLDIITDFVAEDVAIEFTRRQNTNQSTDSTFDENTFVIRVIPCEGSENWAEIGVGGVSVNVVEPATYRNARLTPRKNLKRWQNIVAANGKSYNFAAGNGNYVAVLGTPPAPVCNPAYPCPEDYLAENAALNFSGNALFYPEEVTLDYPITWGEYNNIRQNPYGIIELTENNIVIERYFLQSLEFRPDNLSKFTLIKAR